MPALLAIEGANFTVLSEFVVMIAEEGRPAACKTSHVLVPVRAVAAASVKFSYSS